jgi:hypothetical protein
MPHINKPCWLGGSPQNNVHLPTNWYPWIQAGSYYSLLALRVDRMINICDLHSLKKTASPRNHGLSKDCLFGSLDVANLARKAGMIVSWWSRLSGALRRKLQVLKNKTQMSWAQLASKCKRHRKTRPDLPRIYTLYIYTYIYKYIYMRHRYINLLRSTLLLWQLRIANLQMNIWWSYEKHVWQRMSSFAMFVCWTLVFLLIVGPFPSEHSSEHANSNRQNALRFSPHEPCACILVFGLPIFWPVCGFRSKLGAQKGH